MHGGWRGDGVHLSQLPRTVRTIGHTGRIGVAFGGAVTIGPSEGELVGRVALAAALGALVGIERELTDKAAGIRTHALVALGSAAFAVAGFAVLQVPGVLALRPDIGRIAAQVASGIGFIGAGLIIFRGERVRGLTTAADIWAVAAIGVLAGLGFLVVAAATAGLVLVVVVIGRTFGVWLNVKAPRWRVGPADEDDREV